MKDPVTGFLHVDGYAARTGVLEYYRLDETTQQMRTFRELRLDEEVFAPQSLAGFGGASFIESHPVDAAGNPIKVTLDNVKGLELGTVLSGRQDGAHVAVSAVIKDKRAIKKIESGKTALSVGYAVDLEESPGVHPVHGRYDAIQRNIVVNHLALVDRGRAGETARLRMDGAMVDGVVKLTTIVDGHQHTFGPNCSSTSWSVSEGADTSHGHDLVRGLDGVLTLTENAGHTHGVIDTSTSSPIPRRDRMDPEKQQELIRSLNEQLKAAEAREGAATATAATEKLRADTADGKMITLQSQIADLTAKVTTQVAATETEAYRAEKFRADSAEQKVARFSETFESSVRARSLLMKKAAVVMGDDFRMDDMNERQIMSAVVTRLDSAADVSTAVSDGVITGRFLSLVDSHAKRVRSDANVADILGDTIRADQARTDSSVESKRKDFREQWKAPLPNSRLAARKDA